MRRRPLCAVFLFLIVLIIVLKTSGSSLWTGPDKKLRSFALSIEANECVLYGTLASREEKTDSFSYFLSDAYLASGISFKDADSVLFQTLNSNQKNNQNITSVSLLNVRLYFPKEAGKLKVGSEIIVIGKPEVYRNASNPGGFDAADYYAAKNCCISMYVADYKLIKTPSFSLSETVTNLKEKIKSNLENLMQEKEALVLCAMLTGEKSALDDDVKLDYSSSGLSHLLSISGMHVYIIGMSMYRLLLFLKIRIKAACVLSIFFIALYCLFTGGSEATVRASFMLSVLMAGKLFLRTYDPVSALSLVGSVMLLLNPHLLFRAGFQLSFAASAGIVCIYSPLISKANGFLRTCSDSGKEKSAYCRLKRFVVNSAIFWFCVNLAIIPLIQYHFYEIPLYSVFMNIIFVPLFGIVLIVGLIGVLMSFVVFPAAGLILFVPQGILKLISLSGKFIRFLPFSTYISGKPDEWQLLAACAGIVIFALAFYGQKKYLKRLLCLSFVLILLSLLRFKGGFSITALDVGQGDCIIIRNGNSVYMVDGGSTSNGNIGKYTIVPYLKSQGIKKIAAVFLTHDDSDHLNGIEELFSLIAADETGITVKKFCVPYWMNEGEDDDVLSLARSAFAETVFLSKHDKLTSGSLNIEVIGPEMGDSLKKNAGSLVLSLEYNGFKALLTGDVEGEGEDKLVGTLGKYDYLKAAHHGSKNSSSREFLNEVSPEICVISAPEYSIYGHPSDETIERIEETGAHWYQTGLCGAVTVRVKEEHVLLSTYLKKD